MTANRISHLEGSTDQTADQIVGEAVHILMRRQGMTQAQLAAHVGIHQAALSHKLRGNRPWSLTDMQRAATALGVDVTALVAGLPRLDSNQQPSGYLSLLVSEPPPLFLFPTNSAGDAGTRRSRRGAVRQQQNATVLPFPRRAV